MDQFVNWFPKNAHWLAILGMIFAVLGAIYNAYSVDWEGKFIGGRKHGGMTRGLTFGLVGGIIVAIGLGTIGLLLLLLEVVLRPQVLVEGAPTDNPFLSVVAYTLIGAVLGIMFGFLVGFVLDRIKAHEIKHKTVLQKTLALWVAFLILFIISLIIQFVIFHYLDVRDNHFYEVKFFLDVPLYAGSITSVIFSIEGFHYSISKMSYFQRNFVLYFIPILFIACIIFIIPTINSHPIFMDTAAYSIDFIFGFLLTNALIYLGDSKNFLIHFTEFVFGIKIINITDNPQDSKIVLSSWIRFIFWPICGMLVGFMFLRYAFYSSAIYANFEKSLLFLFSGEALVTLGLLIGIRHGKMHVFIKQGGRANFLRGFIVGFIVFGIYASNYVLTSPILFTNMGRLLFVIIGSAITGGVPIGILIGCFYSIGPSINSKINKWDPAVLGQIGFYMTISGIIFLGIQALFAT